MANPQRSRQNVRRKTTPQRQSPRNVVSQRGRAAKARSPLSRRRKPKSNSQARRRS